MNLEAFFKPRTMAVIGVSATNDRHPANVIYNKNRHRYPVEVFPVNPRGGLFQGAQVFTQVSEIPAPIDLAVIAVRAEYVADVMLDCIKTCSDTEIIKRSFKIISIQPIDHIYIGKHTFLSDTVNNIVEYLLLQVQ